MTELNRWYKLEGKALKKWVMHLENGLVEVIAYPGREILWRALVRNPRHKPYQQLVDPPERLFMVVATGTEPSSMEKAGEKALAAHRKYVKHPQRMLFNVKAEIVWQSSRGQYHAVVPNSVRWSLVPDVAPGMRMWRRPAGHGFLYIWTAGGSSEPKGGRYSWEVWTGAAGAPKGRASTFKEAAAQAAAAYKKYLERGGATLFNPALIQSWDRMTRVQRMLLLRLISVLPEAAENLAKHSWATLAPVVKMKLQWAWRENKGRKRSVCKNDDQTTPMLFDIRRNVDPRFSALAKAQRGRPEMAMLRVQHAQISQLYGTVAEHVGDLTHRMSEYPEHSERHGAGYQYVAEKVRKTLRWLTNPYGFEREVLEQVVTNYNYLKGRGTLPRWFRSPEAGLRMLKRLGRKYANEHRKLPVFNAVQRIARDAAIAVGEWRFKDAVDRLYGLEYLLDQGREVWSREAMKTKNNPKRPRTKTYYAARFRPAYPMRGEYWAASTSIDSLPPTVVGGVYKVSAPSRVSALAQARAAHARGQ